MIDVSYKSSKNKDLIKLLDLYELFPFHNHPLWQSILKKDISREQIVRAESQHYLRTKVGQAVRKTAMEQSAGVSSTLWESIIETYIEECTESDGTPTHLDLAKRILYAGNMTDGDLSALKNTPGNSAAIALYQDIANRGPGCHIIGAGMVEHFYSQLCPNIFRAYTTLFGFSAHDAETYSIHGVMDQTHAERAFTITNEVITLYGWDIVESSVRDAFVATSLHYDGMLQAATGKNEYWNGL